MYTTIAALTAALATTASAFDCSGPYFSFYNRAGNALSYQRLDPALYPGTLSPHLHSFDGGNALTADMGFDTTQESSCTTARIKPDKSLYWRPTLYWNGNNTGFYRVPDKFLKIYYKFGDSGNVRANVTEFPEGFGMMAGTPTKRSDDGNNPGGMKWSCLQENYQRIDAAGFPKGFTSCKEGLTTEITFPSCWNGDKLDPKNPSAHMTWPTAGGEGLDACPDGFKVARFPSIFIEFWYDVSSFDGQYSEDDTPWVLSNGDPTGFGFHADFLNGWEKGVLAKATAETGYCNCGCGCGNDQMKQCFGADNVNDDNEDFKTCTAKPFTGGEKDTAHVEKLPGCNPLQAGPAKATPVTGEGCVATPGSNKPVSSEKFSPVPSSSAKTVEVESAKPTSSISVPEKQEGSAPVGDKDKDDGYGNEPSVTPSASEGYDNKPSATPSSSEGYRGEVSATPSASEGSGGNYASSSTSSSSFVPTSATSLWPHFSDKGSSTPPGAPEPTDTPPISLIPDTSSTRSKSITSSAEEDCKSPVYITVTPTVTVTVGTAKDSTSCTPTVFETTTNTATVTVSAGGYKHRRHAHAHHNH